MLTELEKVAAATNLSAETVRLLGKRRTREIRAEQAVLQRVKDQTVVRPQPKNGRVARLP